MTNQPEEQTALSTTSSPDPKGQVRKTTNGDSPDSGQGDLAGDFVLSPYVPTRILMVTRTDAMASPSAETMLRLRSLLEAKAHIVSATSPAQWRDAAEAMQPDIVLLDSEAAPSEEMSRLCRTIKSDLDRRMVLAVLSSSDETTAAQLWPSLQDAGADDFIAADVPRPALESRVHLLTRFAATMRDLESTRERLARHMQIDEATQLLNRRFFFQASHRECSRARRYDHKLACLMVDIDYLEEISKLFGYPCVEYVLRAVAYTVRQWTRDSDIVGRFSDHKFAVLLPETDIEGATSVREKILNAIAESQFEWEGKDLPLSVSIGESERRRGASTATKAKDPLEPAGTEPLDEFGSEPVSVREELASLLEDADAALSVAKRASMRPDIFVQYTPTDGESEPQNESYRD